MHGTMARQLAERIATKDKKKKPAGSDALTTKPKVSTAQTGPAIMNSIEKTFKNVSLLNFKGESFNNAVYLKGDNRTFNTERMALQISRGGLVGLQQIL